MDFSLPADVSHYLRQLDHYARDSLGGGAPLPRETLDRVARDLATRPQTYCLLAFLDQECIGFATCFGGYSTFRARPSLNIHDIAVLPAFRGKGVADRLLQAIAALARAQGCCRVTLEVRDDNPRARRVYERSGFARAQCGTCMERTLTP